ncbi:MAG TPA: 16S rRNA (cytidine(1402)-2'-O)-methyltransferase [Bacillota bacterium]|nr:16S rRNA (cytidine(1402)-2'-O)-methyltransferase [Bacillota bacterium]
MAEAGPGQLILCPTPVGNLEDITLRSLRALREADVVFAEDTRHTRILLDHYGIRAPLRSCHDHNELERATDAVARIERGQRVVVVSDAGTPGIADPGFRVVAAVIARGLPVTALPRPSALLPALTMSGLPTAPFCFLGFLPRRPGARRESLRWALGLPCTGIAYEAPHRVAATLREAAALEPARPAALVREVSKVHEEVARGTLAELAARYTDAAPRGEITLLWGPAAASVIRQAQEPEDFAAAVARGLAEGLSPRRAARRAARAAGLPERQAYDRWLRTAAPATNAGEDGAVEPQRP